MRNYLSLICALLVLFVSCEGPQGPPGLDGEKGPQGEPGTSGQDGVDGTSGSQAEIIELENVNFTEENGYFPEFFFNFSFEEKVPFVYHLRSTGEWQSLNTITWSTRTTNSEGEEVTIRYSYYYLFSEGRLRLRLISNDYPNSPERVTDNQTFRLVFIPVATTGAKEGKLVPPTMEEINDNYTVHYH